MLHSTERNFFNFLIFLHNKMHKRHFSVMIMDLLKLGCSHTQFLC